MTSASLPPLALTMGEPAGIGGELTLKAWLALGVTGPAFVALDDPARLAAIANRLKLKVPIRKVAAMAEGAAVFADALPVLPIALPQESVPGEPDPAQADAILTSIRRAVELCQSGEAAGIVTNPIQKSNLTAAGFRFPGHTEYLEHLAGPGYRAQMMLAGRGLRVVLVTIHEPLAKAIARLTMEMIVDAGRRAAASFRSDLGIRNPRIAVAGLNPHAGEDGTIGHEDQAIVTPAVTRLQQEGIRAFGPLPPDTMFTTRARRGYDVALCLYHDQGLIPLKTLDMMGGVNVTLGLPFVRTSPDHGTALDIAGRGVAEATSLIAAIRMAAGLSSRRMKQKA
ncbi:MAG: 4-hydroxythreonine-4-phosphate dehydrogenase PdxA [Methylocystis sp.]|nr:4-hydroxythreonine-4-phosphate dehydrogenase PdxA [Methylocystis sp.]MCA3584507.1 4-hydroxythreonine-4-phosphate dehydrogenase PdxA [Methylocystis sp.]MCA3589284.1 4-hydroxythreonine-4-phosphate dehydrogenase PdxA [Methylocystis sp.]MCA3591394.1 4-hydroxythreonine-4-phosphate dehydrogenase PdxA [Methylocystis sp.]